MQQPLATKVRVHASRAVTFTLTAIALVVVVLALMNAGSARTVYQRTVSPDGWNEARVQFDDAGALSDFSRLVFVKPRWNYSDEPLLSCRAFWGEGEQLVQVRWLNSHTLLIAHKFPEQDVRAVSANCGSIRILVRGPSGGLTQPHGAR